MVASGYNSEIVRSQGATALIVGSSGEIRLEPGGELYGLTRQIEWSIQNAYIASASGAAFRLTSGLNPGVVRANGTTDPTPLLQWTSAAGTTTRMEMGSRPLPDDLDILSPMILRVIAKGSSANANNGIQALVHVNGGADIGSTMNFNTGASAFQEKTVTIASGGLSSAGVIALALQPQAHASGTIQVRSVKATYKSRARAT